MFTQITQTKNFISSTAKLLGTTLLISTIAFGGNTMLKAFAAVPSVDANIRVVQDGTAPFDASTYDPIANANGGLDASAANGIVRISDFITYQIDVSVNDTNNTNVTATVTLDSSKPANLQNWAAIPQICKVDAPFVPVSSISADKKTLICNLGDHPQGSKITINALAGVNTRAVSKDLVNATVTAKGDQGVASTPFTSKDTMATGSFSIDLTKFVPGDQTKPTYPGDYIAPSQLGPAGEAGRLIEYNIALNTAKGSEGIAPDAGMTTKSFVLTDIFSDNNNGSGASIPGSTSNGKVINWGGKQGCVKVGVAITGTLTCSQVGNTVTINVNDVNLSSPDATGQVFAFNMYLWVPNTDINQGGATTLIVRNDISGISGILSATGLQNNNTGIENAGNNGINTVLEALPPGNFTPFKSIYGAQQVKSGTKKVSAGEIYPVSLSLIQSNSIDLKSQICDNIDTSKVEFVGKSSNNRWTAYSDSASYNIDQAIYFAAASRNNPGLLWQNNITGWYKDYNPINDGVVVEYSTLPHISTAPTDLMSSKCANSDGNWSSTIPTNPASVTKVRMTFDKKQSELASKLGSSFTNVSYLHYSFDLKVKTSTAPGTKIPNFALANPEFIPGNTSLDSWSWNAGNYGDTTSTDPTNPKFSLSYLLADRVTVVGSTVAIGKDTVPSNLGVVKAGDTVEWELTPQASGPVPVPANPTVTITDTLPIGMTYVPGSATVINTEGTLTGPVVSGQTLTWTWNNINFSDGSNPKIRFKTVADKDKSSATYVNNVTLTTDSLRVQHLEQPTNQYK
jgi:uncharacterized repeat protein (TIGR01451 family)